jgi:KEOPS complex subunit Cgi121
MSFEIIGARGKTKELDQTLIRTKELEQEYEVTIQLMDAGMVYGREHLRSAIIHAERAFTSGTNTANSMGMEIMLYASGERQISQAISKMGIKPETEEFALINYSSKNSTLDELSDITLKLINDLSFERDDSILKGSRAVLINFGISEDELQTVSKSHWENLILERIAMVDIIK